MRVLYITGFGRSGSTVADNVLGQIDGFFSAGEMRLAWDAERLTGRLCGCGAPVTACDVWSQVLPATPPVAGRGKYPEPPGLWLPLLLGRRSASGGEVAARVAARYRLLREVTGCRVVVDSSKKPLYGYLLDSSPGIDLFVWHLVRDPRGVAWSWQKQRVQPGPGGGTPMRRHGPVASTVLWVLRNRIVERQWGARPGRYRRTRYEDLMAGPRDTLAGIAEWLGEPFAPDPFVAADRVRLGTNHTVWGNPGRFERGDIQLALDDAWTRKMNPGQRRLVTLLAGPWLSRYGYA